MVDAVLAAPRGHRADAARAGRSRSARASTPSCSKSCRPAASCARASTARWSSSTGRRSSMCAANTRSRRWSIASGCARTSAAPGGVFRDGVAAGRGRRAGRLHGRSGARRARVLQQVRLPDLRLLAAASSNRGCSPSTARSAPARACDGLGTQEFFDPGKVVANPHLSLAGGAVRGWDRRNAYYFQLIQSLARHTASTSRRRSRACRRRSGTRAVRQRRRADRVQVPRRQGRHRQAQAYVRGHRPNLERRYRETESADGARGARQVPLVARLPRLPRHAPQSRRAQRVRRRQERCRRCRRCRWTTPSSSSRA